MRIKDFFPKGYFIEPSNEELVFCNGTDLPVPELHEIPFSSCTLRADMPDSTITEPSVDLNSSGVVLVEPDYRVWIRKVTGEFGGYEYSFAKGSRGRNENGVSLQQIAHRELFEEMGLTCTIIGHLKDMPGYENDARFYFGIRTGGDPRDYDRETEKVLLVPLKISKNYLNMPRDRFLVDLLIEGLLGT